MSSEAAFRAETIAWIRRVLLQKDWTLNRWCSEAQMPGSTLARFVNEDGKLLKIDTIVRLAQAAGVAVPLQFLSTSPLSTGGSGRVISADQTLGLSGREVLVLLLEQKETVTTVELTGTEQAEGLKAGDLVEVMPVGETSIEPGDLILIQHEAKLHAARQVNGLYHAGGETYFGTVGTFTLGKIIAAHRRF